jgi:hypothetical protein
MNKCLVNECNSKVLAKNLCSKHYYKNLKYGSPLAGYSKIQDGERIKFLLSIKDTLQDDCINWPFSDNGSGYGTIIVDGKKWYAHRYLLFLTNFKEGYENLDVRHSCGMGHKGCVNPNHLFWGTRKENFEDKKKHGTYKRGTEMPGNILSENDVLEICKLLDEGNLYQFEIADRFGCSKQHISKINVGESWNWLTKRENKK